MSNSNPNQLPTLDQVIANLSGAPAPAGPQTSTVTEVAAAEETPLNNGPRLSQVSAVATPAETVPEVAESVVEAAPVADTAAPVAPKEDPASKRFAALSRRERELRQKEQEIQTRIQAAEQRAKELDQRDSRYNELKKSPLKVLKELGISYADVTQDAVGAYNAPVEDPTEARFKSLEQQIEEAKQAKSELAAFKNQLEQREVDLAMRDVMETIKETATTNDKYEYIATLGDDAFVLVKDVMAEFYAQHQKLLSYEEACDIVEKHYEDSVVAKLTNTKKVKSRFAPKSEPAPKPSAPKEATERVTTLTHRQATVPKATVDIDKLSKSEALAVLAGKLKFND